MKPLALALLLALAPINLEAQVVLPPALSWPSNLPVYDHIVIVVEENKNYEQIIGNKNAPYINDVLRKEGANLTQMYAEEHHSEGNYFWLFSGNNQKVGYLDDVPQAAIKTANLGAELIRTGHSFKGYSEGLPEVGSTVARQGLYARKHCPWVSFANLPNGHTVADSSNLRFPEDFPSNFDDLPTVAFVIPNLVDDMHDGKPASSIPAGDKWLRRNLDAYYQWAKQHNSLLILTFDESDEYTFTGGVTNPADPNPNKRNRIATVLAGAHIKPGDYPEDKGVTHVNLLRTLEAMYKLNKSGSQQWNALKANIADDFLIKDVFEVTP
ncbi:MAG: alkaline phosphatase family protein [Terriglobales bacterium]